MSPLYWNIRGKGLYFSAVRSPPSSAQEGDPAHNSQPTRTSWPPGVGGLVQADADTLLLGPVVWELLSNRGKGNKGSSRQGPMAVGIKPRLGTCRACTLVPVLSPKSGVLKLFHLTHIALHSAF